MNDSETASTDSTAKAHVSLRRHAPLWLTVFAWVVAAAMLLPVAYLIFHAVTDTSDVEKLWGKFALARIGRTLLLMAIVTTLVTTLAVTLAWLTTRTNLRFAGVFSLLLAAPLAVPPYVTAYALLSLGGDNGLIVRLLGQDNFLLAWLFTDPDTGRFHLPRITGLTGAIICLTLYNLPYVYLPVRAAFHSLDASLEEASQSLGRSRWFTARRIMLPALRPAILAGALLAALHVVADFGVVSLMRYDTLSASLYARYNAFDLANASRLGLLLISLASLLVICEWLAVRRLHLSRVGVGTPREAQRRKLGPWQLPAMLLCMGVFIFGVLLPALTATYWLTYLPDTAAMWKETFNALWDSLRVSLPAAVMAVVISLPIAILGQRYPGRFSAMLERLPLVGYAVPALAFGLSLIMFTTAKWVPDVIFKFFYQSIALLLLAYTFHFLAEALGPVRAGMMLTRRRLEEAARSLGSSQLGALCRVTLPLMRRGLMVGMALVFLSCMKELPLTMLLSPLGLETLARSAWDHTENADFAAAAPFALAILVSSSGLVALLLLERPVRR